jgi:hypothetical protein
MIVKIPLSFEYRKTKVQWALASAHITGWAKLPYLSSRLDRVVDGSYLMAEITTGGVSYPVRFSRKRLPEGEFDNLWMEAYSDADVEHVLSAYEPLLLVPTGKTFVEEEDLRKNSDPADAWQLREEFLKLEPTSEKAIAFLNKWGRWNSEEYLELSEIIHLQLAVREAVMNSQYGWFASEYSLPSDWRRCPEFPYFSLLTDKAEAALRMTVTADLLEQSTFKTCARPDCGQPFKVESKHEKKFCSHACGHLEAVRRSRKAAKKGA